MLQMIYSPQLGSSAMQAASIRSVTYQLAHGGSGQEELLFANKGHTHLKLQSAVYISSEKLFSDSFCHTSFLHGSLGLTMYTLFKAMTGRAFIVLGRSILHPTGICRSRVMFLFA